jgi:phosphodiesterase/alkaline phosphatase D-like protein
MYRSANDAADDATKTMLGPDQKAWLKDSLNRSGATFKVIFSSVPFNYCKPIDDWEVFATEREELFSFIATEGIRGVVLVSADRHYLAVHEHAGGLTEFHLGPLAAGLGAAPPNIPEVAFASVTRNYGEFTLSPGESPTLVFRGFDETRSLLHERQISVF